MNADVQKPAPSFVAGSRIAMALKSALMVTHNVPGLLAITFLNFHEGLVMTIAILPSIISVGLLGLLAEKYMPVFDCIGYIFYLVNAAFGIENAVELAKASDAGLAEIFLPAMLMDDANRVSHFIIGIVSVLMVFENLTEPIDCHTGHCVAVCMTIDRYCFKSAQDFGIVMVFCRNTLPIGSQQMEIKRHLV